MLKFNYFSYKQKIRRLFYKVFRVFIFKIHVRKRKKANKKMQSNYGPEIAFRRLEKELRGINYPNNNFNKIMSIILNDIELFGHITSRFRRDRKQLKFITHQDNFLRHLCPNERSYPSHPARNETNESIKIDTKSLFIFGMILVNRSLLLLKMYLPDRSINPRYDMFNKIGSFYFELASSDNLSSISQRLRGKLLNQIKWLYSSLRFYRNEFIEHLDKGYQQGMNYGVYMDDFALSSYKWDYGEEDNKKVEDFRTRLENVDVKIGGRSSGGKSLINRYYIQMLFDNIILVPDNMIKEAMDLIEDIGVHSPQPEKVISEIESYIESLFEFMVEELDNSELIKYKN